MTHRTDRSYRAAAALLDDESAELLRVMRHDERPVWLIVMDYGWAETIIAECDYDHHARGVALAVAEVLGCEVEWGQPAGHDDLDGGA